MIQLTPLANYRKSFYPYNAKSDPTDAYLLYRHADKLVSPYHISDQQSDLMDTLCKDRRAVVDELTQNTNQLRQCLLAYYPIVWELFEQGLKSPMLCAFLKKWPTPKKLSQAKESILTQFFYQHNSRSQSMLDKQFKRLKEPVSKKLRARKYQGRQDPRDSSECFGLERDTHPVWPAGKIMKTSTKKLQPSHRV